MHASHTATFDQKFFPRERTGVGLGVAVAATLVVSLLCLLPVLVAANPPLHDYQFHIARMYILSHWQHSAALQSYYNIESFLLPNVGMDAVVLLLSYVMPIELAGRVFVGLTLISQLTGCMALYRSLHGRYSLWPLIAAAFVFNWIFLFGFLNYLLGLGLLLWATAIWIAVSRRSLPRAIAYGAIFAGALFFCHVISCGLFAVVIAGYELQHAWGLRRADRLAAIAYLAGGASIFVLPIGLFFLSATAADGGVTTHNLANLLNTPAVFVRVLLSGDWLIDGFTVASLAACLAVVMLRGGLRFARSMRFAVLLLGIVYLVVPHRLLGGWGADSRIPVLIIFVLIASSQPILTRKWERIVIVGVFATLVVRTALLTFNWYTYDQIYNQFRTAMDVLPENSVLFSADEYPVPSLQDMNLHLWQPPLVHVATLAMLSGRDIFVPQTWATRGQQAITVTPAYEPMYRYMPNGPLPVTSSADLTRVVSDIHGLMRDKKAPAYLLLLYPHHYDLPLPDHAKVVASGQRFVLMALE